MDFKKSLYVLVLSIFLIISMGSVLGAQNFTVSLLSPATNTTFYNLTLQGLDGGGSPTGSTAYGRMPGFNCSIVNSTNGAGLNVSNITLEVYNRSGIAFLRMINGTFANVSYSSNFYAGSANFSGLFNGTNASMFSEGQGYSWNCLACMFENGSASVVGECQYASANSTFHIDRTVPVITVFSPHTSEWGTNNTIRFGATVTDTNEASCYLWGTFNGSSLASTLGLNGTAGIHNGSAYQSNGYNNGTAFNFTVITVNDSANITWTINCGDRANNSAFAANFSLRLDTTNPGASLTSPSVVGIYALDSITYSCTGSDQLGSNVNDTGSNVSLCQLVVKKPDGSSKTTKVDCNTNTAIKDADTNLAGGYEVQCQVKDNAGLLSALTVASKFTAYSRTSGTSATGGNVYGGPTAAYTLNLVTKEEASVSKYESGAVTFSLDGTAVHKITFTKVAADSVTLTIESTPKTVTLKVGETQKVDVNDDGKYDIEVKLQSISEGGSASILTKRIEAIVPVTEKPKETPTKPAETPTTAGEKPAETMMEKKGVSTVWWWVIGIVVVVIVVWFVMRKK